MTLTILRTTKLLRGTSDLHTWIRLTNIIGWYALLAKFTEIDTGKIGGAILLRRTAFHTVLCPTDDSTSIMAATLRSVLTSFTQ